MNELHAFVEHCNRMTTRCTREADEMDAAGVHQVADLLRRQRSQWIQLAAELDQHLIAKADAEGQLDIPLDLEGATA